jgi:PhoPQ-activated pathogenicity-related protein
LGNNDLTEYIAAADPAYRWERLASRRVGAGILHDLKLSSQIWQGLPWTHRLHLYLPDHRTAQDWALLTIGSDYQDRDDFTHIDTDLACRIGIASAHLYDVPNQPLFDGLREDELLAHTLSQALDTGDMTWPLLSPMVKSAVRALDAIAEFCGEREGGAPKRFILHGASKRGWTTWLTAVVDPRVRAIIPEVYDNLNLFAQMPHQVKVWESYSEMIDDFTEQRLQDKMRTPLGHVIASTIDPYTYRQQLTLPKLLIQSLNDRYWATDALNLYWDDLSGVKHTVYAPNQSHHISDREGIASTFAAFVRAVIGDLCLPEVAVEYDESNAGLNMCVRSAVPALNARVWTANSANQDFREASWSSVDLTAATDRKTFTGAVPRPGSGYTAVMADCVLDDAEKPFVLSTPVRIVSSTRSEA